MVYYMILGAILNGLMAPFFFSISSQDPLALTNIQLHLHMVASVASNVSGITFGVLYIFLRSHKMQRIGPLGQVELGGLRKEKTIDSWPSTDIFNMQIEQPVSPARIYQSRTSTTRSEASEKTAQHVNGEKYSSSLGMVRAAAPNGDAADGSHVNGVPLTPLVPRARKDSYSLFPSQRETLDINPKGAAGILPCTTYTPMGGNGSMPLGGEMPEEVLPPPTIRISGAFRQNRYSSLVSSATVQIGLRVSNLSDVKRLEAPFSSFPDRPFSPGRPSWPLDPDLAAEPPNAASSSRPNGAAFDDGRSDMAGSPIRAAAETRHGQTAEAQHGEPITLSPTVYSPKKAATPPGTRHHHRGVVASNPPSPGVAMTNDRQLVGTAQWI
ncbi:hypothetical protein Trco_001117 [Trichoderma cornu-damae]|uniref:Uncharacterized protein n=1 Tax=Trichoderma cornu-damae TaxID=654480 RepID=A0A9P8QYM3_9HYPO|nr:hypothetical protein Trco_001117 [Trichoderma cornu-damae]